ncbi:MAG: hypothetical protein ACLQBK_13820 [Candidatus Sulfotelmatobacter sp.]
MSKAFFASFAQPLRPLRLKASFHAATENPNRKVRKEKMREGRKGSTSKGLLRILRATFATFAIKSFVPQSHQEPGPQSTQKKPREGRKDYAGDSAFPRVRHGRIRPPAQELTTGDRQRTTALC